MLVFPPQTIQGRLGAALSALIVIFCLIGLTLSHDFYAGVRRRDYWVYYTNQSNLLVFVYFALIAPVLYAPGRVQTLIPHVEFAIMLCIMLTHLIYHHVLAPFVEQETAYLPHVADTPITRADSCIQHYIVPLLTFFYWLFCSPGKSQLSLGDAAFWFVFPLGYMVYILVRARIYGIIRNTKSAYPYPFLDVDWLGPWRVAALYAKLLAICLLVALGIVTVTRAIAKNTP